MCGIVGMLGGRQEEAHYIEKALSAIAHRGPDDFGTWFGDGVWFGHRRLSVIELTAAGHQPMQSAGGRYVVVFNGEIYNHLDLRHRLENQGCAPRWRGSSDTETLLGAIAAWGIPETLKELVGMFAIAVWDREVKRLTLARDRFGEKPLYYGTIGNRIVFGSELKALRELPGFCATIDRHALALYARHNYVPAPYTIYSGFRKLVPGTWISLDLGKSPVSEPTVYWSALESIQAASRAERTFSSDEEAVAETEERLAGAVKRQMVADVPIGAFLSGGIDSSTVVALMQAQSGTPVRTFSIGYSEDHYDEARFARRVAEHLGTDHSELYVAPCDALAVIPRLPVIYDEPFADSSQVPTYLVAQLAKRSVTVSLSGDGGDELFGGYARYFRSERFWRCWHAVPIPIRRAMAGAIRLIPPQRWNAACAFVAGARGKAANRLWGDQLHKGAALLCHTDRMALYRAIISHSDPRCFVMYDDNLTENATDLSRSLPNFMAEMMYADTTGYLPDDVLAKVDRAAMAVSLETRVPLLDHTLFEFVWSLPFKYKVRGGTGKWALREVLYRHVPKSIVDRPKMGFGVPIDSWLRGPLREWAEELLDERRLKAEGFFYPAAIRQRWAEHQSGQRNWQFFLWTILMFQAWLSAVR